MTDASDQAYNLQMWQNRLGAAPNHMPTPERRLHDALSVARSATNRILELRAEAVKRELQRRAIGSKAGGLLGKFANPFRPSDVDTTIERSQMEAAIRQSYVGAESKIGGRFFASDASPEGARLSHSFGIDELGDVVWVHAAGQEATVTRYHLGLELGDPIFKVQSRQSSNGEASPTSVDRSMIRLSELERVAASLALLQDAVGSALYGISGPQPTPSTPAAVTDLHSRSLPVDFTGSDQLAA